MTKNRNSVLIILLCTLSAAIFNSACVRERDTNFDMARDIVVGDFVFSDAFHIACDAATKSTGETLANYKTTGYCATLFHDNTSIPRVMIIDFGAENCMCNDNRTRRGQIKITYTGENFNDEGNVIQFEFDNYYVNDFKIMGTQTVENKGRNILNQIHFDHTVDAKFLRADTLYKDTVRFQADRTITWISGDDTPIWSDDVYEYIGEAYGRSMNNEYFALNITSPLVREVMCRYIKAGRLDLQPQGKSLRKVDYGDGNCDNNVSVEINGKRYAFEL